LHAISLLDLLEAIRHTIYKLIPVLWCKLILFFLNSLTDFMKGSGDAIAGYNPLLHDAPDIFDWIEVRGGSWAGV